MFRAELRDEVPFVILVKVSATWWLDVLMGYRLKHGHAAAMVPHMLCVDVAEILRHAWVFSIGIRWFTVGN